ncbi:MAG: response regulator transcription factor [Planctomycetes bacterium]|nr:response regulator transcription factor [Planctomycetota bacterium]
MHNPVHHGPTLAEHRGRPCIQVVDDDVGIQGLLRTLGAQLGCDVVTYGSITEFESRPGPDRPGCFVFDLMLPDGTGLDLLQHLVSAGNGMPVVFMSGIGKVAEAVQALKLGSIDFLEKPFEITRMRELLQRAIQVDRDRRDRADERASVLKRFGTLSPREHEVMELVVQGAANKEVAAKLGLSPKTVEVHRANVMRKIGARTLAELVRLHVVYCETEPAQPAGVHGP